MQFRQKTPVQHVTDGDYVAAVTFRRLTGLACGDIPELLVRLCPVYHHTARQFAGTQSRTFSRNPTNPRLLVGAVAGDEASKSWIRSVPFTLT